MRTHDRPEGHRVVFSMRLLDMFAGLFGIWQWLVLDKFCFTITVKADPTRVREVRAVLLLFLVGIINPTKGVVVRDRHNGKGLGFTGLNEKQPLFPYPIP